MKINFTAILNTFERKKRDENLYLSLNSILNQTLKPDEILIINSGKNKLNISKKFKTNNRKIDIYNFDSKIGISKKRNIGSKKSSSKFLAYLDDDDEWDKHYLEKSYKFIKQNTDANIIISDVYIKNKKKIKLFKKPRSTDLHDYFKYNPGAMGSNIIIKKNYYKKFGGFDESLIVSEDKSFVIDALLRSQKIFFQENFVFYNINNEESITKKAKIMAIGIKKFYLKYKNYMKIKDKIHNHSKIYFYKKQLNILYIFHYLFFLLLNKIYE